MSPTAQPRDASTKSTPSRSSAPARSATLHAGAPRLRPVVDVRVSHAPAARSAMPVRYMTARPAGARPDGRASRPPHDTLRIESGRYSIRRPSKFKRAELHAVVEVGSRPQPLLLLLEPGNPFQHAIGGILGGPPP